MKEDLMKLIVRIDKMKSITEIKEAIAQIIIQNDNLISKTDNKTDIDIHVDGKNCCMPSACVSNCGACDADINTSITLPETDPKKCCLIM